MLILTPIYINAYNIENKNAFFKLSEYEILQINNNSINEIKKSVRKIKKSIRKK